jgi:hypothetical protein
MWVGINSAPGTRWSSGLSCFTAWSTHGQSRPPIYNEWAGGLDISDDYLNVLFGG